VYSGLFSKSVHGFILDFALVLIANISSMYFRLKESDRAKMLQIISKRIIVNLAGEIIEYELQSPFAYLRELVDDFQIADSEPRGSEQPLSGGTENFFKRLCKYYRIGQFPAGVFSFAVL
jgi:hypothetical protein